MITVTTTTTAEVKQQIVDQIETATGQTVPMLPKSFIRVMATAVAGIFVLLYKYAGWQFLQLFVRSASFRETEIGGRRIRPLVEWGRLSGEGDPNEAIPAELNVEITVDNQTGILKSGSHLVRGDTGVIYVTTSDVPLDAATKQVVIRAVSDQDGGQGVGVVGNLDAGDTLNFASPLANVQREVTVLSQTQTGADAESEENYRRRVLARFQRRPQGGAYADYDQWGRDVSGIVAIYPYRGDPGEVDVYVEATPASSGDPDGIPTAAQLSAVEDAIELDDSGDAKRRPVGAFVNVNPITRLDFTVTVNGLTVDNQAAVESDITEAVKDWFLEREPFIEGLTVPPRKDRIAESAVAGVVQEIVSEANGIFNSVTLEVSGSTTQIYSLGIGEKAKAGTVDFA